MMGLPNTSERHVTSADVCDAAKRDGRGCQGAPDWVIEVISPTTASHAPILKREAYKFGDTLASTAMPEVASDWNKLSAAG